MKQKCPKCNSDNVGPIFCSYPSRDIAERSKEQEDELSCVFNPDNPVWHCNNCGNEWK